MTDPVARLTAALADRYAIEREVGVGGMATVYLARDLKHDRRVAIKVLRPELAAVIGAERFLAEIKTTANLQHPHILPLHDSGEVNGTVFYVMPYVEGESLRDRLTRERQLPIADAVRIASEMGQALDYAHRHGVIHRDIKPENILLHDGRALVADFGIALAATSAGGRMTETGMSLGTPHYMSPEQAMGERDLDARTDVYALGCVLYEMLTGETPFTGPTAQAIVAKVMTEKPALPSASRETVPEGVEDAVMTALAKLPADRFASAGAMVAALAGGATTGAMTRSFRGARAPTATRWLWPVACMVAVAVALWGWLRSTASPESPPSRLAVLVPNLGGNSTSLQRQLALSPDGSTLYYTVVEGGDNFTMRHPLDAETGSAIPGIPNYMADYIISPDGREMLAGSVYERKMVRFPVSGGTVQPIPDEIAYSAFTAYAGDGALWFTSRGDLDRGIARLATDGSVTRPFGTEHTDLSFTQILPGDQYALVIRRQYGVSTGPVLLLDLKNGEASPLIDGAMVDIRYTAGYLVYVLANGALNAVPFDLATRRVGTNPVTLATNVSVTGNGTAQFVVAANGTIAFIPEAARSLVLVDRSGGSRPLVAATNNYHSPRFSPDGRRVAVDFTSAEGRDVWMAGVGDGSLTRATFDRDGHDPTWTPDGRFLTYVTARAGVLGIRRLIPGSAATPDSLLTSENLGWTGQWLRDGSALITAATALGPSSAGDIALVTNAGAGPLEAVVASRFTEQAPDLSPDDSWLAFVSNQSGQNEVYVRALKGGGEQIQVSTDGGAEPAWSPDGRELFYHSGSRGVVELVAASLAFDPVPRVTARQTLFPMMQYVTASPHRNYDLAPDGRHFVMVQLNPSSRITVIQHMPALIARLQGGGVVAP